MGAGQHAADLGGRSRDDLCGERPGAAPDSTHLLSAELQGRLLCLGSGLAGSSRPQPAALGRETAPRRAYAESKACDVALALAWNRRLPDIILVAVDPGWVKTKLASPGAPGEVSSSAETFALARQPTWPRRPTGRTGRRLRSPDRCGTTPSRMRSSRPAIEW